MSHLSGDIGGCSPIRLRRQPHSLVCLDIGSSKPWSYRRRNKALVREEVWNRKRSTPVADDSLHLLEILLSAACAHSLDACRREQLDLLKVLISFYSAVKNYNGTVRHYQLITSLYRFAALGILCLLRPRRSKRQN